MARAYWALRFGGSARRVTQIGSTPGRPTRKLNDNHDKSSELRWIRDDAGSSGFPSQHLWLNDISNEEHVDIC